MGGVATGPPPLGPVTPGTLAKFGPATDWDADRDVESELYDLRTDFTQARDIAAQHPDKVKELQELWWKEAGTEPGAAVDGRLLGTYGILPPLPTQTRFTFAGGVDNIQWGMTSHTSRPLIFPSEPTSW